jgi:hypothetical protein
VHFLSFKGGQLAFCFLAADAHDAQAVGGGFAGFDPFVGARGVLYCGVQGEVFFFVGEELEIARAGEDWVGRSCQSVIQFGS